MDYSGEFIINTHGRLVFAYRYQYCDYYPDPEILDYFIKEALGTDE